MTKTRNIQSRWLDGFHFTILYLRVKSTISINFIKNKNHSSFPIPDQISVFHIFVISKLDKSRNPKPPWHKFQTKARCMIDCPQFYRNVQVISTKLTVYERLGEQRDKNRTTLFPKSLRSGMPIVDNERHVGKQNTVWIFYEDVRGTWYCSVLTWCRRHFLLSARVSGRLTADWMALCTGEP